MTITFYIYNTKEKFVFSLDKSELEKQVGEPFPPTPITVHDQEAMNEWIKISQEEIDEHRALEQSYIKEDKHLGKFQHHTDRQVEIRRRRQIAEMKSLRLRRARKDVLEGIPPCKNILEYDDHEHLILDMPLEEITILTVQERVQRGIKFLEWNSRHIHPWWWSVASKEPFQDMQAWSLIDQISGPGQYTQFQSQQGNILFASYGFINGEVYPDTSLQDLIDEWNRRVVEIITNNGHYDNCYFLLCWKKK